MPSPRARQRLLSGIVRDIDRIESYLSGLTRSQFAGDGLRRDAVEQCLARITTAAKCLPAGAQTSDPALAILRAVGGRHAALGRLDSDVVWSLVECLRHQAPLARRCVRAPSWP